MFNSILIWLSRVGVGLLLVASILPLLPTGAWMVRLFDFPRVQLLLLLAVPITTLVLAAVVSRKWRREHWMLLLAIAAVGVWQFSYIAPFTPLWSKELADGNSADDIRLVVANLTVDNQQRDEVRRVLRSQNSDVLLLIEIDDDWQTALRPLRETYPHRMEAIRDDGLGLALWSRLPFENAEVRHLVSERRPSIFATVSLPDGNKARLVAVHPTPPGLDDETEEGRRDSRVRDAELVLVARAVSQQPEMPWIVAGDLNDVAWSHTTRLFKRLSGLRDPRVGRQLLNTYHANFALLRYPIDHVFLPEGSTVNSLGRVRLPGSDHFGVIADFQIPSQGSPSPATPEDKAEASEIIEEGKTDAEERDVEADPKED